MLEPPAPVSAALVAEALEQPPLLLGVRRHHAAFPRRDLLVRVEGEDRGGAVRADACAAVLRAERLAGVLDQRQPVPLAELPQGVELARVAVDVDGDDGLRPLRDRGLDRGGIEVHRALVDVGEDGHCPLVDGAVRRRDERVRRRDRLVALPQPGQPAEQVKPGGARRDRGGVRCSDALREALLEAFDRRAEGEPPRPEHLEHELLVALVDVGRGERYLLQRGRHRRRVMPRRAREHPASASRGRASGPSGPWRRARCRGTRAGARA